MKNKGFTLVELIAVITILAVVSIIVFPYVLNLIRNNEVKLTASQENIIYGATELYLKNNPSKYELNNNYLYTIEIQELIDANVLKNEFVKSVKNLRNDMCVNIAVLDDNKNTDMTVGECLKYELKEGNTSGSDSTFWDGQIKKSEVEKIDFVFSKKPDNYIGSWDVSSDKSNSIIAYYSDVDNNSLYELTVVSNGKIMAPKSSSYLFAYFSNMYTINFENFDTSDVTDLSRMFYNCKLLKAADLTSFDVRKVTTIYDLFSYCEKISSIDVSNWQTDSLVTANGVFYRCLELTTLDLSSWDISKVTTLRSMFNSCPKLEYLNISTWKSTSALKQMEIMFYCCYKLKELDFTGWDTSNVVDMRETFYGCTGLTKLNINSFKTSKVKDMSNMFANCSSLTTLDLSSFDMTNVTNTNYMFSSSTLITTAYARTQTDADKLNASYGKPTNINFIVK